MQEPRPPSPATRTDGPLLARLLSHDAGPLVQFIKYAVAGGIATTVSIVLFYTLGSTLWPCLTEDDFIRRLFNLPIAAGLTDALRGWRAVACNATSFVVSNGVAYVTNVLFVFRRGRHSWLMEVGLFYLVSAVSATIGTLMMKVLISQAGLTTTIAFGANLVSALLINYAMRRFVIFKG
jgi:putative flippase GtrA